MDIAPIPLSIPGLSPTRKVLGLTVQGVMQLVMCTWVGQLEKQMDSFLSQQALKVHCQMNLPDTPFELRLERQNFGGGLMAKDA